MVVHADAVLALPGIKLDGAFDIIADESQAVMTANGELSVGTSEFEIVTATASGAFLINGDGLAGKAFMNVGTNPVLANLQPLGFDLSGRFDLIVNTTEKEANILLPDGWDPIANFNEQDVDYASGVVLSDRFDRLCDTR